MILVQWIITPDKIYKINYLVLSCNTTCQHKNNRLGQESCVRCVLVRAYGVGSVYLIYRHDKKSL